MEYMYISMQIKEQGKVSWKAKALPAFSYHLK